MNRSFLLILVLALALPFFSSAEKTRVLSPGAGVWANKQCLFVDLNEGEECYYSLSGSDPLESGFVYDGPVLLDVAGDVTLKVVVLCPQAGGAEERESYEISYGVSESAGGSENVGAFVRDFVSGGIVCVNTAKPLPIPQELTYSFWGDEPSQRGRTLLVRRANNLSRYVPCTVSDGAHSWRFLVYVSGIEMQADSQAFPGEKTSPASAYGGSLFVSGANGGNNPLTFSASGGGGEGNLSLRLLSSGVSGEVVRRTKYTDFSIDALDGEELSGDASFEVFRGDEMLGVAHMPFSIDRKSPEEPIFVSSAQKSHARGRAEITVGVHEGESSFFVVKGPFVQADEKSSEKNNLDLDGTESFSLAAGGEKIVLSPQKKGRTFYRVFAYAVDAAGNRSGISSYEIALDPLNYYFAEKSKSKNGDGSMEAPFTKVSQVLRTAQSSPDAHFFVEGTLRFPRGESVIRGDCSFSGTERSKIVIPGDSCVVLDGAKIELDGFVIEKERGASEKMFVVRQSSVSLKNCEIVGNFSLNAIAFLIHDSDFELSRSGLTVQGAAYSCPVIAEDSRIVVSSSRVSSVGQTAVCFSVEGGEFTLESSRCRALAHFGRIAELVSSKIALSENVYVCDFELKTRNMSAIWTERTADSSGDAPGRFFGATMFR